MAASPCVRVALPKRASSKVMPLGAVDVEGLTAAVPERYRPPIVLAAGMGLRQAECFGLTVDRVEFLRRAARVDRQLVAVRGGVPEIGPPKTTAGPHRTDARSHMHRAGRSPCPLRSWPWRGGLH